MKKLYNSALRTHRRMKTQASLNLLISISKQYKKQVKKVKKEYSKNLNMHIMQLKEKDPRAYWQLLNNKKSSDAIDISLESLTDHFTKLHAEDEVVSTDDDNTLDPQGAHVQEPINLENLNCEISDDEIINVAKTMKNNKACGVDQIRN